MRVTPDPVWNYLFTDSPQLDESSIDYVRIKVCGRAAFLHGIVCERALLKAGVGASDKQCIL